MIYYDILLKEQQKKGEKMYQKKWQEGLISFVCYIFSAFFIVGPIFNNLKDVTACVLSFAVGLILVILAFAMAASVGTGHPSDSYHLTRNEIYEKNWSIKENNKHWIVSVKNRWGNNLIVRINSDPPNIFKVIGEENYIPYPDSEIKNKK